MGTASSLTALLILEKISDGQNFITNRQDELRETSSKHCFRKWKSGWCCAFLPKNVILKRIIINKL
jgi:hypothetical protein